LNLVDIYHPYLAIFGRGFCWRKISSSRQAHSKPKRSWLKTCAGSEACQSIFLKLTKDEK
jgi:hypothetical protein